MTEQYIMCTSLTHLLAPNIQSLTFWIKLLFWFCLKGSMLLLEVLVWWDRNCSKICSFQCSFKSVQSKWISLWERSLDLGWYSKSGSSEAQAVHILCNILLSPAVRGEEVRLTKDSWSEAFYWVVKLSLIRLICERLICKAQVQFSFARQFHFFFLWLVVLGAADSFRDWIFSMYKMIVCILSLGMFRCVEVKLFQNPQDWKLQVLRATRGKWLLFKNNKIPGFLGSKRATLKGQLAFFLHCCIVRWVGLYCYLYT